MPGTRPIISSQSSTRSPSRNCSSPRSYHQPRNFSWRSKSVASVLVMGDWLSLSALKRQTSRWSRMSSTAQARNTAQWPALCLALWLVARRQQTPRMPYTRTSGAKPRQERSTSNARGRTQSLNCFFFCDQPAGMRYDVLRIQHGHLPPPGRKPFLLSRHGLTTTRTPSLQPPSTRAHRGS
jgi:hypothetical protein